MATVKAYFQDVHDFVKSFRALVSSSLEFMHE